MREHRDAPAIDLMERVLYKKTVTARFSHDFARPFGQVVWCSDKIDFSLLPFSRTSWRSGLLQPKRRKTVDSPLVVSGGSRLIEIEL